MEAVLPIFFAAGLFVLSNSSASSKKESFSTFTQGGESSDDNLEHDEKPFESQIDPQGKFINAVSDVTGDTKETSNIPITSTLTGKTMTRNEFRHNNMQPFFGSRITQQTTNFDRSESILDNRIGTGTQQNRKREIGSLFAPEENINHAFGTPINTSFMQTRMNPGQLRNNEKPFDSIRVGPSLCNGKNENKGSSGYNAGMECREKWMPRNVDDLRAKNNPKQTFGGVVLGGKANVTNRGKIGEFEQYGPDRFFENTPDRYLTTTGVEKAPRDRCAKQVFRPVSRIETTSDYFGNAQHDQQATYIPGTFQPSNRPDLASNFQHVSNIHAPSRHQREYQNDIDSFRNSQTTNNRNLTGARPLGIATSMVSALFTPLMDTLRPSRRSNIVGNHRGPGNAISMVPNSAVVNPGDRTRTTIREMTENTKGHVFVGNQNGSGTNNNPNQPVHQQRDTTTCNKHVAPASGAKQQVSYESAFNAQLIDKSVISQGREPKGSGVHLPAGMEFINLQPTCDARQNTMNTPLHFQGGRPPSSTMIGTSTTRKEISPDNRNSCELNQNLQNNPYHLSITA